MIQLLFFNDWRGGGYKYHREDSSFSIHSIIHTQTSICQQPPQPISTSHPQSSTLATSPSRMSSSCAPQSDILLHSTLLISPYIPSILSIIKMPGYRTLSAACKSLHPLHFLAVRACEVRAKYITASSRRHYPSLRLPIYHAHTDNLRLSDHNPYSPQDRTAERGHASPTTSSRWCALPNLTHLSDPPYADVPMR